MRTQLAGIRAAEASHAVKMARIRACNMAMMFFIMPVSSFIIFAVVRRQCWLIAAQTLLKHLPEAPMHPSTACAPSQRVMVSHCRSSVCC